MMMFSLSFFFSFFFLKSFLFLCSTLEVNQKYVFPVDCVIESNVDKSTSDLDNSNPDACQSVKTDVLEGSESSIDLGEKRPISNGDSLLSESALPDYTEPRGSKRPNESEELKADNKKSRAIIIDSDDETHFVKDNSVCNGANVDSQSDSKEKIRDSGAGSVPLLSPNEKFDCTACSKIAVEVHQHPLLKVIICWDCKCLMEEKMQVKVWT
jgi:transcriptional regulator ATRX